MRFGELTQAVTRDESLRRRRRYRTCAAHVGAGGGDSEVQVVRTSEDCEAMYSGNTHGSKVPAEHLENDVRNRCGLAAADPGWMPSQLPEPWAPELAARLERLRMNCLNRGSRSPSPERLA